jgi:hypothetical protein
MWCRVLDDESLQRRRHCQMPINQAAIAKKKFLQLQKNSGASSRARARALVGRSWPGPRCIFDPHSHSSMPVTSPGSVGTYRLGWRLDASSLRGSSSRHGSPGARRDFCRDQLRALKGQLGTFHTQLLHRRSPIHDSFFFLSKYSRRPLSAFDHTQELIL